MMFHGKADDRSIIAVEHNGQIQLAIGAFDLRHIAQVFDTWRRGSEIPLHQIVALRVMVIAFCQAMRALFALQQAVFFTKAIAFPAAWTKRRLHSLPQPAHAITWVLLPRFSQGRYQLCITICPHGPMFPVVIPFPSHAKRLTAQGDADLAVILIDPCVQLPQTHTGYRPAIKPSALRSM